MYLRTPLILTSVLALSMSGCALPGLPGSEREESALVSDEGNVHRAASEQRVARDFVAVLKQLNGFEPAAREVRFLSGELRDDSMLRALEQRMRVTGYRVTVVDEAAGPGRVTHEVEPGGAGSSEMMTHTISVDDVQLRRQYRQAPGLAWQPAGSLYVRGADASGIRLEEPDTQQRVNEADRPRPESVPPKDAPIAVPRAVPRAVPKGTPLIAERLPDPALPIIPDTRDATDSAPLDDAAVQQTAYRVPGFDGPPDAAVDQRKANRQAPEANLSEPVSRDVTVPEIDLASGEPVYAGIVPDQAPSMVPNPLARNMMDLGDSNFSDTFEAYVNVEEVVMVFPNDSLTMGKVNKALIHRTVEKFDPERDLLAIVGCSLGKTSVKGGNEALALGRASRVREELLFSGVPSERILDEGCWAGERSAEFPSRGVVLTHKRHTG